MNLPEGKAVPLLRGGRHAAPRRAARNPAARRRTLTGRAGTGCGTTRSAWAASPATAAGTRRPGAGTGGLPGRAGAEDADRRGVVAVVPDRAAPGGTRRATGDVPPGHRPHPVVTRAAHPAVGDARTGGERALSAGGEGPRGPARPRAAHGVGMIGIRTDHVLAGGAGVPYPGHHLTLQHTARGRTGPAGQQTGAGERPASGTIVRTAWLHRVHGRSFVRTMIDLEPRRDTLDVLEDQRGQPTWSADVTGRLAGPGPQLGRGAGGVLHAPGSGETGRHGPARDIFRGPGTEPGRVRSAYGDPAPGRRQEFGLPPLCDRQATLHEAFTLIRKESLRETP